MAFLQQMKWLWIPAPAYTQIGPVEIVFMLSNGMGADILVIPQKSMR